MRSSHEQRRFPWWCAPAIALTVPTLLTGISAAVEPPGFVVVVNAANPVTSLSPDEASRLFLKKVTTWQDGQPVLPVDQPEEASVRIAFTRQVIRRQFAAVRAYWQQRIFAGRDLPPPVKNSDAEVLHYVEAHPTAIGYVSTGIMLSDKYRAIELTGGSR